MIQWVFGFKQFITSLLCLLPHPSYLSAPGVPVPAFQEQHGLSYLPLQDITPPPARIKDKPAIWGPFLAT